MLIKARKGLTLLELVIVIIIVGVLTSVALPRFFRVIEVSRSVEALANLKVVREAIERCYLMNSGSYEDKCCAFDKVGVENPGNSPNAHFRYMINYSPNAPHIEFGVVATRNTRDFMGTPDQLQDQVTIFYWPERTGDAVVTCGRGIYESIGKCPE